MFRQWAHDVVEALAYQDDFCAGVHGLLQLGDTFLLQARLQKIFEEFFAEEIEAVAADSAQDGVQQAGGENAVGHVEEWAGEGEDGHGPTARPAFQETLRIPRKEAYGADGGEVQQ